MTNQKDQGKSTGEDGSIIDLDEKTRKEKYARRKKKDTADRKVRNRQTAIHYRLPIPMPDPEGGGPSSA